jgi:PilZ domain
MPLFKGSEAKVSESKGIEARNSAQAAATENASDRRRSVRVHISMPILVRGHNGTQAFQEETVTVSVNAHGCMVRLATQLKKGQEVSLINPKTAEELPCSVIFLGQKEAGKMEVGVEFAEPSPVFWRISFPPEDWDPSERKRPMTSRPPNNPAPAKR